MRSELRIADLKRRKRGAGRLMNVKVPAEVGEAIEGVAKALDVTKTDVVVALLNHGLDVASRALGGWRPPEDAALPTRPRRRRRTEAPGGASVPQA